MGLTSKLAKAFLKPYCKSQYGKGKNTNKKKKLKKKTKKKIYKARSTNTYCLKCRKKTLTIKGIYKKTKNNRNLYIGYCNICTFKKTSFV